MDDTLQLRGAQRYQIKKASAVALATGHPWIYRKQLSSAIESIEPPALVELFDGENRVLGYGIYEPLGPVGIRLVGSLDLGHLLAESLARRSSRPGFRLVNGEADGLSGLTIDIFGDVAVIQPYLEFWRPFLAAMADKVREMLPRIESVWVKPPRSPIEPLFGAAPSEPVPFAENKLTMLAWPVSGQKTGFYLDLIEVREWLAAEAQNLNVLNVFASSGALSLVAVKAGARRVISVDQSEICQKQASALFQANELSWDPDRWQVADAWKFLETEPSKSFDLVILDPPNLCTSQSQVKVALRAWQRLFNAARMWLKPGGRMLAINCSARLEKSWMQMTNRKRLFHRGMPDDHTVSRAFPEGNYLSWAVFR